jgi:hypothetical protein
MKIEAGSLFEGRFHAAKIERQMTALPLAEVHMVGKTLKVN